MKTFEPRLAEYPAQSQRLPQKSGEPEEDGMTTTRISIEIETLKIVRRAGLTTARCPICHAEVEAVNLEGDSFAGIPAALLRDWIVAGKMHLWCDAAGPAQLCLPSLLHCFESQDVRKHKVINRTL